MDIARQQAIEASHQDEKTSPQARKAVWGAFVGFFVDNYDIFLPVIALAPAMAYFIPKDLAPTTAAIVAAMIFATTLIGRPLGAIIFGHFADTIGRKKVTVICVLGFGVVTLLIAALPGYQHWGDAVLWVFILLRLIDGIFLGGEYTSANPLAMEYSPKAKRGFYGALIQSAASLGTAAISLVTLAVLYFLPAGDINSPYVQWGWRIPFVFGALMAFGLAYYYHNSVEESEVWRTAGKAARTESPLKALFRGENLRSFLQVFVVMTGFWLSLNAALAIMPGLLVRRLHVTGTHLTFMLVVAYVVLAICYVIGGIVSQRIGRRTYLMVTSAISAVVGTFFYYKLLGAQPGDLPTIGLLATITTVLVVLPGALGCVYINERFQTGVRASGFGLGYSLAIILPAFYVFYQAGLGLFMPFHYTVLVLVVIGAALIFIGAAWGPETKDVDFGPKPASGAASR
ncbi:MAG: Putative metabolite transport protein [Burkholderiaceae bacterium]|jgi:MFS family permease|nr:MAG: Putative metabolite transport protein [Burkholderiaceae bacterium]